jgi:hypothetical protein
MIFLLTVSVPFHKREEAGKGFLENSKIQLPSFIKKWEIFGTVDGKHMTAIEIIYVQRDKADEGLNFINNSLLPFTKIEGITWNIQPLLSVKDMVKTFQFGK